MSYINKRKVRAKFHECNKQITKDGLHALDSKIDAFILKVSLQFNGHHRRINADVINLFKI